MIFLNLLVKARTYKKNKKKVQYVSLVARQQTQGSSRLLSKHQKISSKVGRTGSLWDFKVRNNIFFFKTKKTHLSMSRGPIAKKKKSMITLGFKSRIHITRNAVFGPIASFTTQGVKARPYLRQFSNLRTSSLSVFMTKRILCIV